MSKSKAKRQQTLEIDKVLRLVDEGLEEFSYIWGDGDFYVNSKQEQSLRAQLYKLQKYRTQIRGWQDDYALTEYYLRLQNARALIEAEMRRFKVSEKSARAKNNEEDFYTGPRASAIAWADHCRTKLQVEITRLEEETSKKQKRYREEQICIYRRHLDIIMQIQNALEAEIIEAQDVCSIQDIVSYYVEDISRGYAELGFDVYDDISELIEQGGHEMEDESQQDDSQAVPLIQPAADAINPQASYTQQQMQLQIELPPRNDADKSDKAENDAPPGFEQIVSQSEPSRAASQIGTAQNDVDSGLTQQQGVSEQSDKNTTNSAASGIPIAARTLQLRPSFYSAPQGYTQFTFGQRLNIQAYSMQSHRESQIQPAPASAPVSAPVAPITLTTAYTVAPPAMKVVSQPVLQLKPAKSSSTEQRQIPLLTRQTAEPHVQTKIFKVLSTAPAKSRLNLNTQPNSQFAPATYTEQVSARVYTRYEIMQHFKQLDAPGFISMRSDEEQQLIRENALFVAQTRSIYYQYHSQCVTLSLRQVPLLQRFDNLPVARDTAPRPLQLSDPALQKRLEAAKQVLRADPVGALAVSPPYRTSTSQTPGIVSVAHCFYSEVQLFDENVAELAFYAASLHAGHRDAALAARSLRNRGWRWSPRVARWVLAEDGRVTFYDSTHGVREADAALSGVEDVF